MSNSHLGMNSNMVVPRNLGQQIAEANRALESCAAQPPQRKAKMTKRAPRIANGRSAGAQIAEGTNYLSQLAQQQQQSETVSIASTSTFSSRISLIKARFSRRHESQQQLLSQEKILRTQIRMGV